jgi:hypothetical protein
MSRAEMAGDIADAVFQVSPPRALGPFDAAGGPFVAWIAATDSG